MSASGLCSELTIDLLEHILNGTTIDEDIRVGEQHAFQPKAADGVPVAFLLHASTSNGKAMLKILNCHVGSEGEIPHEAKVHHELMGCPYAAIATRFPLLSIALPTRVVNLAGLLTDIYDTDALEYCNSTAFMSEGDVAIIGHDVLKALEHMHGLGLVHLDVKPENIFVRDDGYQVTEAVLGDFEYTSELGDDGKVTFMHGFGTVPYMAPEILKRRRCGAAADMWSLGVTLYLLLQRELPFGRWHEKNPEIQELYKWRLANWNLDEFDDEVSEDAKDVIMKMLAYEPSQRITASEALEHPFFAFVKDPFPK